MGFSEPRTCECGVSFTAQTPNRVRCDQCRRERKNAIRRHENEPVDCGVCGSTFKPYRGGQVYCSRECGYEADRNGTSLSLPTSRRCRNKDCIERFVPVNDSHWFHEPACRLSERLWDVEDILREEGALLPEASHMELAKRAFGQKNTALRKVSQLTSLRDYLSFEIQGFHDDHPEYRYPTIPKPVKDSGKKSVREVVIQASDWQIGKWENGFGVEATKERIENLKRAAAAIVERQNAAGYRVPRIRLSFGGDMIEGCYIYRGQNVTGLDKTSNTHRLTQQIRTAAYEQADLAAFCATIADEVAVEVVGGNHGRPNGPNDYADPEDNFDVMSGWWASDLTRNTKRITWNISENWWTSYDVMGHYVVSLHGDQWNGPLSKLDTMLPSWVTNGVFGGKPAVVLTHHRHTAETREIAGITVFQNGTIDGGSNWYLRSFGRASRPVQNIIVMSERYAPEAVWPVFFGGVSGALAA